MGSKNDLVYLREVKRLFKKSKISFEIEIISAHRNIKELVFKLSPQKLETRKVGAILAIAHSVSNLPAIIAGYTKDGPIPVIGVGITKTESDTLESLFSVLSIPKGIPLVNTGVNEVGLYNAALFCIKLLKTKW